MSETQKSPEKEQETPQQNGVELLHIQEAQQLRISGQRVRDVAQRQRNVRGDNEDRREAAQDLSDFSQGFDLGVGNGFDFKALPQENFVESAEEKDKREMQDVRNRYQQQLKRTYDTHMQSLTGKPEEQEKLGVTYIEGTMRDLEIKTDNPGEDDVRIIAETFPDTWRATLLDPETAENNPDIRRMRNVILDRVADSAAGFDLKDDFNGDQKAYEDALLQNFRDVTGLSLTREELESYLTSDKPQEQRLVNDMDLSDNKGRIQEWRKTSSEDLGNNTILSTLGVSGGDATNYLAGAGSEPGEFSTEFPEDVGAAVELIKGEAGKNVREGTATGEAIIAGYFRDAGFPGNTGKTPWCMAFVQAMARRHLGYTGTKTLSARDGLKMGRKVDSDEDGAIVITRGSGPSGCHIGISVGGGEYISGNSGNTVKVKKIPSGAQFRSLKSSGGGH